MEICPCCKRRMPQPKSDGRSKELLADLRKADEAIAVLNQHMANPEQSLLACERDPQYWGISPQFQKSQFGAHIYSLRNGIAEEIARLERAKTDYRLLWRIYRRNSKAPSYVHNIPSEVAA